MTLLKQNSRYDILISLGIDGMAEFLCTHIQCTGCPIDYCNGNKDCCIDTFKEWLEQAVTS